MDYIRSFDTESRILDGKLQFFFRINVLPGETTIDNDIIQFNDVIFEYSLPILSFSIFPEIESILTTIEDKLTVNWDSDVESELNDAMNEISNNKDIQSIFIPDFLLNEKGDFKKSYFSSIVGTDTYEVEDWITFIDFITKRDQYISKSSHPWVFNVLYVNFSYLSKRFVFEECDKSDAFSVLDDIEDVDRILDLKLAELNFYKLRLSSNDSQEYWIVLMRNEELVGFICPKTLWS